DATFNAIVMACWETFSAPTFKPTLDRFGIACGLYCKQVDEHYQAVLASARTSASAQDFLARADSGTWAKQQIGFLRLMRCRLDAVSGRSVTDEELLGFLRCMVILHFDLQQAGSSSRADAVAHLESLLASHDPNEAQRVFDHLIRIAAEGT